MARKTQYTQNTVKKHAENIKKERNAGKVVQWKRPSCSVTSIMGILSCLVDSNCPKLFGPCYSNVAFNAAHFIKADAGLL